MYPTSGSSGAGSMYGLDWVAQPVILAVLYSFQSAP